MCCKSHWSTHQSLSLMCRCWQVVHQGQVIGAVLADTLTNAQRAAAAVLVQYDVMEPIITIAVSHKNTPLTNIDDLSNVFCVARVIGESLTSLSWPVMFVWKWRSVHVTRSTLSGQGSVHIGWVSWNDCWGALPDELHVSLLPWWVPAILCLCSIVGPLWLCQVKGGCCLPWTCHLPFWQND